MVYNVTYIHAKLDKLLKNILCDEIDYIYKNFTIDISEKIMLEFADDADKLVFELSEHLDDPKYCKKAIMSKKPEVLFTLLKRYNMLIQYLNSRNKNTNANVPDDNKEFFTVMLTNFWELALDNKQILYYAL